MLGCDVIGNEEMWEVESEVSGGGGQLAADGCNVFMGVALGSRVDIVDFVGVGVGVGGVPKLTATA